MATLRLIPKPPENQLPPDEGIVFGSNSICMGGSHYFSIPPEITIRGYGDLKELSVYDITSTIYPPNSYNKDNVQGMLVTEVGRYADDLTEIPVQNLHNLHYHVLSMHAPEEYGLLEVGTYIPIDSFPHWGTAALGMGVIAHSYDPDSTDPEYPITIPNGMYFKYKLKKSNGEYSNQYIIRYYRGTNKEIHIKFKEVCDVNINTGTINIINMSSITDLNVSTRDYNGSPVSVDTMTQNPLVLQMNPQVSQLGTAYIPRIHFSYPSFSDVFEEYVVIDPRLTYAGKPIYYGQSVSVNGINNGLLQYDASGMTSNQVMNVTLYVMYEGFASSYVYVRSN